MRDAAAPRDKVVKAEQRCQSHAAEKIGIFFGKPVRDHVVFRSPAKLAHPDCTQSECAGNRSSHREDAIRLIRHPAVGIGYEGVGPIVATRPPRVIWESAAMVIIVEIGRCRVEANAPKCLDMSFGSA